VKVGGPLRGYNRAVRVTMAYCFSYFILGVCLSLVVGPIVGHDHNRFEVTAGFVFGQFWICALIFPTATAANLVFARIFRKRTWRGERWRPWTAAALGIVLTLGGMLLLGFLGAEPPRFIKDILGRDGGCLYFPGWFVLFSNLALLVAWALPGRRRTE
jgi:hypothetical protein